MSLDYISNPAKWDGTDLARTVPAHENPQRLFRILAQDMEGEDSPITIKGLITKLTFPTNIASH